MRIPEGFQVSGVHCGIKSSDLEDLTLILADRPATGAGVYTQNVVYAAAVGRNRGITPSEDVRVVLANSGNANTCTGERGEHDNEEMARLAAHACGVEPRQVLVMSTGIIGQLLPMDKIAAGVSAAFQRLANDKGSLLSAARGLMTTDTFEKVSYRHLSLPAGQIHVTGMAKGAGMIGPNMATMLAVVLTDAELSPHDAQESLAAAVDESFNCMSVEGHMSTSDTVLMLASGAAVAEPLSGESLSLFRSELTQICVELARMIPSDGEGASHLINIEVRGCATMQDARQIARTIANSPLVKTGVAGADPNWGRIVSAAGYSGVKFNPARLTLSLNDTLVYKDGMPIEFNAQDVSASIRRSKETFIVLTLREGDANCRFWTSDLTVDYVRFNSEYHT